MLIAPREEIYGTLSPGSNGDRGEEELHRSPYPTSVHSEIVPPDLSSSEYFRRKELELKMAETRVQERRGRNRTRKN